MRESRPIKEVGKIMKKILIGLLCVLCFLPTILVASGKMTITRVGGHSTMGVIIGPIVGLDGVIPETSVTVQTDYSSYNLTADTPYTNGALRAYSTLGIYNVNRGETNNGFGYAGFVRAMKVKRTDGRVIYDDDGILDVSASASSLASELINYPSYIYSIETTLPNKPNAGFMWTNQQAKFKDTYIKSIYSTAGDSKTVSVKIPTNPSNTTRTLTTVMGNDFSLTLANQKYMLILLQGTGQYENTFWGNTGGDTSVYHFLSNYIKLGARDWSNTLKSSASTSTYNGKTAYYSPKAFTVVATNLNNYVKVNDVQATPQYGTDVVPFADGHHITISSSGRTKVDIENGGEGSYTTYYCFVDTTLPDVSYTYHNANALNNRVVGNITTDSVGAKSQTINEGVFKDQVQVNFGYNSATESPETATYTLNGKTYNLTSGTWLSEEGSYTVTVTDLAGNKTISRFVIDKSYPNANLGRLENDNSYKITRWYLVNIPYGYSNSGSYSYATYDEALNFAKITEFVNGVSTYTLSNISDFTNTHLLAEGQVPKEGDYWYYKSKSNPNLYVYYFDEQALNEVIEYYAKEFVSEPQTYNTTSSLTPNNYGNKMDSAVTDNTIEVNGIKGYIVNNFTFRSNDDNEAYKIYYDYQEDNTDTWKEFVFGVPFATQANAHGLYRIKEVDYVGHETYYYVYLDIQAPMLDVEAKIYGKDKTITETISVADVPSNTGLIYYYEMFSIKEIIEDDKWWVLEVKCPDNITRRYTHLDNLPDFNAMGEGEYSIKITDRANNSFSFKVCLLGAAPEAKFEVINANTQLRVTISQGESYNTITDLKIYRNGVCLNSENGYDEYPDDDTNALININPNTLKYVFNKGGIYEVVLTDNFGRSLTYSYKYEKDLPTGTLVGVTHNGKTKGEVKFIYDSDKYFTVITKGDQAYNPEQSIDKNITTLIFAPVEDSEITYNIQLVDYTDTENYNIYTFTIKTIKPIINLYGVEPNGTTGGTVYATWDTSEEQYTASLIESGKKTIYRKGQILSAEGNYTITLSDEIGNTSSVSFNIDKSISFFIADVEGNLYKIEDIRYINFDIRIIEDEPLDVVVTKDNTPMDYEFGLMITEEGEYLIQLTDIYGNTIYFTFEIDKTPPTATLYGVDNFGITKGNVWIVSDETELTCWYQRDEQYSDIYYIGQELTEHGKYVVYIIDRAKNFITFEFTIDKEIAFDINTYRGGISSDKVRLIAYENLRIVMYKDGKPIEYNFEDVLTEDGEYSFTITDELGNRYSSFFNIITKKKQHLEHILQEDISVESVIKDEENYEYEVLEGKLYLHDEGAYIVNIKDNQTGIDYSFEITIDTTPPTLELVNVENGGSTKKVVIMKNVSESPYDIYILVDGVSFEYKLGDEIEKCGRFVVVLSDEAGNSTTYTFERVYSLNGASIAVIAGLGALVVLLIVLLIKSRHHYYVEETVEEEDEEIEDDGLSDENDEKPLDE